MVGSLLTKFRSAGFQFAVKVPVLRRLIQRRGQRRGQSQQLQDLYCREAPSAATPFLIFKNGWNSAVPGFETGESALFDDFRIQWLGAQLNSFLGQRVLELGPLEAGHTYMMEKAGAEVTAIEANQRAFLKCLIVKNAFSLKSTFLYGDFRPYLEKVERGRFDFILAVGVLYHMLEPVKLLYDISGVTDAFGLWTHYYSPEIIADKVRFTPKAVVQTVAGHSVEVYEQHYLSSLGATRFIGGSEPTSHWLTRDGLLEYIRSLGFKIRIGDENPNHPNGPCILLFASRN